MNVSIHCVYGAKRHPKKVTFQSDYLPVTDALIVANDLEKTGRVAKIEFIEETGLHFSKKELEKMLKKKETEPFNLVAYFDGGYQRDNRLAGLGAVIYFEQSGNRCRIRKNEAFEHLDSNNESEYAAFWLALLQLEELDAGNVPVTFRGDSQVVLNQLAGEWPCFEESLNKWAERIEAKLKQLRISPVYEIISREGNKEADKLATQALNGVPVSSRLLLEADEDYK